MRYGTWVFAAFLCVPALAAAQGYQVGTWGSYSTYPYPPAWGGTYTYTSGSPTVTVLDSWGRPVAVPMQPKFLYYDSAIWTPQGWHRPTSITVIPDKRPRYYPAPPVAATIPSTATPKMLKEPKPPTDPLPKANVPTVGEPIPTVPAPKVQPNVKPKLPPVPDIPKLPVIPSVPGTVEPKLGPTPKE